MGDVINVPAYCIAALLFSTGGLDLPAINRVRLERALRENYEEPTFWVLKEDLKMLLGTCGNGTIPTLSVTDEGVYQSPETKLPSGKIRLDYKRIFFTYAVFTIENALKAAEEL